MNSHSSDIHQSTVAQTQAASIAQSRTRNLSTDLIRVSEVDASIAKAWADLRSKQPLMQTPYFDLQFTRAVASVREDVEIAVVRGEHKKIIALLPFQRTSSSHAEPVGGRLNDAHGFLGGAELSPGELISVLRTLNLESFGFHASLKPNGPLSDFEFCELESHHLDLSAGWDCFFAWAKKNSSTIKRHGQKSRRLEREHGELRFEFHSESEEVLEQLIALKRAKYQRTKTFDILSVDWASDLLRKIHKIQSPNFSGIMSTLHAGERLVAAHIGMITENLLHYWFPTFDPEFAPYSPGTELLLRVAKEACRQNIKKLDLGYGDDAYKFKFCNATDRVSVGLLTDSKLAFQTAKAKYFWRQRLKSIPMKPTVKRVLRQVYPNFGGWNFK